MKRLFCVLLLILALVCILAACDKTDNPAAGGNSENGEHTHAFGDWSVSKAAGCATPGEEKRTCACGASETRELTAAHTFGDWTVTAAPTCNKSGTHVHTCTVCGTAESGTISATGEHNYNPQNVCIDCTFVLQYTSSGIVYGDGGNSTCFVSSVDTNIAENIVLPAYHNGKKLTQIGSYAFSGTSIKSITIPNTVTTISSGAFMACTSLTSIAVPSSVTEIGILAFDGCTALENVYFGVNSKLFSIGNCAFQNCTALSEFDIPDSLVFLGDPLYDSTHLFMFSRCNTFYGCSNLVKNENGVHYVDNWVVAVDPGTVNVTLKNGTVGIANSALSSDALTSITMPESLKTIGVAAFYACSSLSSITLPNSVTAIYPYAFHGCSSLTSITLSNSLEYIGTRAFTNCTALTALHIPDSVVRVESEAFPSQLIVREGGVFYVGKWAVDCDSNVSSVTLRPDTVGIANYAFSYTHLETFTLPQTLKSIGFDAFDSCEFASITIPQSVIYISHSAFSGCWLLESIVFENPNGWTATYISDRNQTIALSANELSDPSTAQYYLCSIDAYVNYYLTRSE